jgi:flavin reductase (DIM6/NTAB) family NADH-FMN oxidoreductase RutF
MAKYNIPIITYPTEMTGYFKGKKVDGKIRKDIKDVDHSAYGGWWPTFFPTAITFLVTGTKETPNVMTSSCVVVVNAYPFMIGMPIFGGGKSPRGDGPRYSLELLQAHPEFTTNLPYIDSEMTKRVLICGSLSGRDGVDKFAKAGFTTSPSHHIAPPIITECPLNLECNVHSITPLGTHNWIIGRVLAVHLDEAVANGSDKLIWRSMPELKKGDQSGTTRE